ncbi:MAG TPA: hypothetical protein VFF52_02680 [Isosphaeraceae bacterium]|nr:hypothetical protein [Isosphaeraceae bacterium]
MTRIDDETLGDERILWRRILPHGIINDEGRYRPQSIAFVDRRTFEISVFVADMADEDSLMSKYPGESLAAIPARLPRSLGGIVARTPENPDAAHRVIVYPTPSAMKKASKILAENAQWVRLIKSPPEN